MVQEVKTVRISSKRQITLPKAFGMFKQGDKALLMNRGEEIVIKPMPKELSETALLSEATLGECWNSKEDDEAFAYLQ